MRFQRNEGLEESLLDEMLERNRDERVQPSVTTLIYCLTKGYYDNTMKIQPSRKTKLYFVIGLGLESVLVKPKGIQAEGERDGIHYHIDSLDYESLFELKSTRQGPKSTPNEFSPAWHKQIKGYLYASDSGTKATLAVLHIIQPGIAVWELEYEQGEIDYNWAWLLERKVVWDQAIETNTPPTPFQYNEDWECRECVYKTLCEANK